MLLGVCKSAQINDVLYTGFGRGGGKGAGTVEFKDSISVPMGHVVDQVVG